MVTPEVKMEWSSDLRVERSLEVWVEWSSNSKSGVEQSSDLEVGWNLEQLQCEMGCPLTAPSISGTNETEWLEEVDDTNSATGTSNCPVPINKMREEELSEFSWSPA